MERKFEVELEKLNERLVRMSRLIQEQISKSLKALVESDLQIAQQVIERDEEVDNLDIKIDKLCQRIFALQQPVATDLRFIMSSLKINNDLERMGDLAVYITKKISPIAEYPESISEFQIHEIAADTNMLVSKAISIIETRNVELVHVIFEDANHLKHKCRNASFNIIEQMAEKSDVILVATNLMLILGQIERIAAYCKNLAESVFFIVEGKIVKHTQNL